MEAKNTSYPQQKNTKQASEKPWKWSLNFLLTVLFSNRHRTLLQPGTQPLGRMVKHLQIRY